MPDLPITSTAPNANPLNLSAPAPKQDAQGTQDSKSADGQSFASALHQQIKAPPKDEKPAAKPGKQDAATAETQADTEAPSATTAPDALAALMPMLPAPTTATTPSQDSAGQGQSDVQPQGQSTAELAAALLAAAGSRTPAATAPSSKTVQSADQASMVADRDASPPSSGIQIPAIAAGPAIVASEATAESKAAALATSATPNGAVQPSSDFQALLEAGRNAQMAQQPATSGSAKATSVSTLSNTVGSPAWTQEIGDRVVWMANQKDSRAELVLNPPQLGRIEVSVTMNGDQATANFVSANSSVREALENALPRLREVLADAGIQLGQAQVGADTSSQWARQDETRHNAGGSSRSDADDTITTGVTSGSGSLSGTAWLRQGNGLVDAFA